jgi:ATP-dependent DNA ligase
VPADPRQDSPAGPDWLHEIKHDGYRMIVQRDGSRVRLFTRNGHDWIDRYPLIVEAALRNRIDSFVIDGEAVLLGVDGVSDFDGLVSRRHDDEVQLYAFDVLTMDGDDLRKLPLHLREEQPRSPTGADPTAYSPVSLNKAKSVPIYSARRANSDLRAWCRNIANGPIGPVPRRIGSR